MQASNKDRDAVTASSASDCGLSHQSWLTSTESNIQQSTLSETLSLKMGIISQHYPSVKELGLSFQDQDSSSTQSTGQSYPEVASIENHNPYQETSLGYNGTQEKPADGHYKSAPTLGTHNYNLPPTQIDCNLSFPQDAIAFPDQHYGRFLAAYGPQAVIHHHQMKVAMMPSRLPLQFDLSNEPIYVNAKQYHGILKRRQRRAKLEAQNKLVKARKPYLHESRHLHAMKRARGSGGRFLNTKKLKDPKPTLATGGHDISSTVPPDSTGNASESRVHLLGNYKEGSSTISRSDITTTSTSDGIGHQLDFRFFGYSSRVGGTMSGGSSGNTYI
ncbi:hypothetical protein Nepgr_016060 [Nepenthes gracilis]|uniref:Nuclear transcription factor Y subunit n=1 Tax=Nepenthes gracilis TaxID=150966 RepID=A0AAD3XRP4_NEPGR|nr:hypothetical protein Nepgr_016060 [Nepenthes gracilis]